MITCEKNWELICDLSWQYGSPALSNEKEIIKLPNWLRKERLPFTSDENNTRLEGYTWDNYYLYKLEWEPRDSIDHLHVYRAKRVDVHKITLNDRRKVLEKLRRRGRA